MLVNLRFIISDPLEQFETYSFICKSFGNLQFFFHFIFIFIIFIFYVSRFGHLGLTHKKTNLAIFNEKLFSFIFNLIGENLHVHTYLFTPVYFYIFLFILISNLIGMVPYTFTVTSSAAITLFISMSFFLGITIIGAVVQRCTLFSIFLPNGVPFLISLFLVVIELISYIARVFSLAIRLFANMMSGHGLLKILAAFVWGILSSIIGFEYFFLLIPLIIVFLVTFLEVVIAFLQAYVFTVLVSIYLNDVLNIGH